MRTYNFTSITGSITYPDLTIYSGDSNYITCQLSLAPTQYLELSFTIDGTLYKEVYWFDSTYKTKVDLNEILDTLFTKVEDSIFSTDITTFTIIAKIIDSSTGGTDDSKLITFDHIMLGKREVGDLIQTIFNGGVYDSGISNLFYFYLNAADHVIVSQDGGLTFTDLGSFPKGISSINLNTFTQTDLYFILGSTTTTWDETFDDTFGSDNGLFIKLEKLNCSDTRTVRLRYKDRFGLWKYKHCKRINKNYSVTGLTQLPYEKGIDYGGMNYDKNKETENSISIISEEQTQLQQNEWKDLIDSDFVTMYVNGVWLPIEITTNQLGIDDKLESTDVAITLMIQK